MAASLVALGVAVGAVPWSWHRTAVDLAEGQRVYREACAGCHGVHLEGQGNWRQRLPSGKLPAPPHDATGHTWHHPDATLFKIVKEGVAAIAPPDYQTDMLGFADRLSDQQIRDVIGYIESVWPADIRARHAAIDGRSPER